MKKHTPGSIEKMLSEQAGKVGHAIDRLMAEVGPLNSIYERLTGKPYVNVSGASNGKKMKKATGSTKGKGGRRKRRSTDELQAQAKAMVEYIVAGKADGRTGSEIKKKFPIGEGITIKNFIEQYAGERVKTTGKKAAMRYFSMKG